MHEQREMLREMPDAPVVPEGEENVADENAAPVPEGIATPTRIRKICVLGYPCVGKSSICQLFVSGKTPESYEPTIEEQFEKPFTWRGRNYTLRILDTAGQQDHMRLPPTCMVNLDAFIIVYGADDEKSFETVRVIHDRIVECFGDSKIPLVVVGNKNDLRASRVVPRKQGEDLAKEWDSFFIEISAREQNRAQHANNEVQQIFEEAIKAIEISRGNMLPNGRWIGQRNGRNCSVL